MEHQKTTNLCFSQSSGVFVCSAITGANYFFFEICRQRSISRRSGVICVRFGNVARAWRLHMDSDGNGRLSRNESRWKNFGCLGSFVFSSCASHLDSRFFCRVYISLSKTSIQIKSMDSRNRWIPNRFRSTCQEKSMIFMKIDDSP